MSPDDRRQRRRKIVFAALTILVLLYGGFVTYRRTIRGTARNSGERELYDIVARRVEPVAAAMSPAQTYRLVMIGEDTMFSSQDTRRGMLEYFFAPIVVDAASDSPWLLLESQSGSDLDGWLAAHPQVEALERFEGGFVLARTRNVEPRP